MPMSRKEKKLIVLHNFTSLEVCTCIMEEMKNASTDIIIVSNDLFCKEQIAKDFDKYFNRGCNIIEVTNLQHISVMQRIVYGLLEKDSFVAKDSDHIVFTLLSEYSRGAATIVHMITSLLQNCDDNRTNFELAKKQLKLHIAHQKLEQSLQNTEPSSSEITQSFLDFLENNVKDITEIEMQNTITSIDHKSWSAPQGPDEKFIKFYYTGDSNKEGLESQITITPESYETSTSILQSSSAQMCTTSADDGFGSLDIQNVAMITPKDDNKEIAIIPEGYETSSTAQTSNVQMCTTSADHGFDSLDGQNEAMVTPKDDNEEMAITPEGYETSSTAQTLQVECSKDEESGSSTATSGFNSMEGQSDTGSTVHEHTKTMEDDKANVISIMRKAFSIVTGSDYDNEQIAISDSSQLPATAKPEGHKLSSSQKHLLYMYINDMLSLGSVNISLPAQHLLNCLTIFGPIPLPLFYVEELDNVVMNAVISKEGKRMQTLHEFVPESPMKQLEKVGVIRKYSFPMIYHKDFDTHHVDSSLQLLYIPKLICDAVNNEIDNVDKALSVLCAQHALENFLIGMNPNLIHLHYTLILCNQLDDLCTKELKFDDKFLITNLKLKLQLSQMVKRYRELHL